MRVMYKRSSERLLCRLVIVVCAVLSFIDRIFAMRQKLLRSAVVLLLTHSCLLGDVLANKESSDGVKKDIFLEILYPESLRYTFRVRPALGFGSPFTTQLSHVGLVVSEPLHGCDSIINRLEVRDNVVLVERGVCSFLTKCKELARNGVLAVIVADSDRSNGDGYVEMMGDGTPRNCSIPAAFMLGKDGYMIRRGLEALGLHRAIINIPLDVSGGIVHRLPQPPWLAFWSRRTDLSVMCALRRLLTSIRIDRLVERCAGLHFSSSDPGSGVEDTTSTFSSTSSVILEVLLERRQGVGQRYGRRGKRQSPQPGSALREPLVHPRGSWGSARAHRPPLPSGRAGPHVIGAPGEDSDSGSTRTLWTAASVS
ncbi:hypothetical protein MTO96_049355 [Rhipicephalus appendiculatus]